MGYCTLHDSEHKETVTSTKANLEYFGIEDGLTHVETDYGVFEIRRVKSVVFPDVCIPENFKNGPVTLSAHGYSGFNWGMPMDQNLKFDVVDEHTCVAISWGE